MTTDNGAEKPTVAEGVGMVLALADILGGNVTRLETTEIEPGLSDLHADIVVDVVCESAQIKVRLVL